MMSNFNDNLKPTRRGFTLVELLFVIAIIAVLGALSAGILSKARRDAQISATRSRITQIEAIMQTVMEDFEVRRMPFRNSDLGNLNRIAIRDLRRRILAALILAEYPNPANPKSMPGQWGPDVPAALLGGRETAEMLYWQNLNRTPDADSALDQPGEFLHLILSRVNIDGISALETLGPNVIGNPDGDAFLDIVDAFGDSMELRILQLSQGFDDQFILLDPAIPAPINEIRFQVVSTNLEEIEPTLDVIDLTPEAIQ